MLKSVLFIGFSFIFSLTPVFAQELTVEKIWRSPEFNGAGVDGFKSMKDGEHYTQMISDDNGSSISIFKINGDDAGKTLISANELKYKGESIQVDDYFFNETETKVLITTQTTPIYRRSYSAVYYLFDLSTKVLQPLDETHQPQTLAEYSPDGKMVSYIYKNDIYVKDLASGKVKQITQDGKRNKIINGTTDWVYEEEFAITKAYDWSPDSKYIGYLRFDEKAVKEFNLTYYGQLYPEEYKYKYPKAGEANSKVTAHIATVKTAKSTLIDLGEYEYIPRIEWSGKQNKLILQTMNRHQNHLKYHVIDLTQKKMSQKVFFEEKSDTYVEIDNNLIILSDGNTILRSSEMNGYNHIYKLNFDGTNTRITDGNWDVIEFYGIDETSGFIYYSSAENGAITKSTYKIKLDGSSKKLISSNEGSTEAEFTQGMKYFIKTYSNANTPHTFSLCDNEGNVLKMLEDNSALNATLKKYNFSKKEFMTFKSGEYELNAFIIKPANFDPSKKYPVFMTVYGGPGSNEVSDSWDGRNYIFYQLLASKGYIVVSVDPRGTMYRGAAFKKSTYLQLGKLETEDFINVAKELQKLSYVDPSRIGIQGWSFGGFATSLCMTKGADQFKMGIAVAPVTNWRYYDNIYTERFMRTPAENKNGYDDNSPINFVNLLKGKFLLIHGSADDNVHYQNSMDMVTALVNANKQFDLFIYPNKNHGIYGGNTRNHLYTMMYNYILENL